MEHHLIFMNFGVKKFIVDTGGFLGASAAEGICNHILPPKKESNCKNLENLK
jgi:hypothetical protein